MKNAKYEWKQRIQIKNLLVGLLASILVMTALAAIGASLISRDVIQEERIGIFSTGAVLIATFIGALIANIGRGNGNFLQILVFTIAFLLILAIVNIAVFEGRFSHILPRLLAVVVASAAAVLINARKRQGRGFKKIRIS